MTRKIKIQKIKFTSAEQEEITKIKTKPYGSGLTRLRKLYGGQCCICGGYPDINVLYDAEGAKQIERYCQKDYDKWKDRMKK